MHVIEFGQAGAVLVVAVGLSAWRVAAGPSPQTRGADRLLGLCTAIAACWLLAATLAMVTSAFYL